MEEFDGSNPKPGVYQIANEEYHRAAGLSRSDLLAFQKGPLYWEFYKNNHKEQNYAMALGSALHLAVLQPDQFYNDVMVGPTKTNTSKAWIELQEKHPDKYIINQDDYDNIPYIIDEINNHPITKKFLDSDSIIEASYFWQDPLTAALLKCRPDMVIPETKTLVDFKFVKSGDAHPETFNQCIKNYGYYLQAPMYLEGVRQAYIESYNTFYFAVVEKEPPYNIEIIRMDEEWLSVGMQIMVETLEEYMRYIFDTVGYIKENMKPKVVSPPYWFAKKILGDGEF